MTRLPLTHRVVATWTGFCASCPDEQPLLLVSTGPHGLRAWLSGAGAEDRELSYTCAVCGRVEHVPATEDEDVAYDATLARWPDWVEPAALVEPYAVEVGDVYSTAALWLAATSPVAVAPVVPAPRPGSVRVVTLPAQRVSATDVLTAA